MTKLLALILTALMLISLVSCSGDSTVINANKDGGKREENDSTNRTADNVDDTTNSNHNNSEDDRSNRLSGTFIGTSGFSEGLALLNIEEDTSKTYAIDENFTVVFTYDRSLNNWAGTYLPYKFTDGLVRISDTAFCDTTGKITTAQNIGVTSFPTTLSVGKLGGGYNPDDAWRKDGYIIAEVAEYTFSSSVIKWGLLNSEFEWIVAPCEEMYKIFNETRTEYISNGYFGIGYYNEDFKYVVEYLNIETLDTVDELPFSLPSENWITYPHGIFTDFDENTMLDLTSLSGIYEVSSFKNGYCAVKYRNDLGINFFNLADEKGTFLFEPIELGLGFIGNIQFYSGDNIIVVRKEGVFYSYDINGTLLGMIDYTQKYDSIFWGLAEVYASPDAILISISNTINCYDRCFTEIK